MKSKRRDRLSKLRNRSRMLAVSLFILLSAGGAAQAQTYQKPPLAVLDVLNAPVPPQGSISPTRDSPWLRGARVHRAQLFEMISWFDKHVKNAPARK